MNCRDFDQVWNQSLDALRRLDEGGDRDRDRERDRERERDHRLHEHAQACPSCRLRRLQFQALRQALEVWTASAEARSLPTPSSGLTERILNAAARLNPTSPTIDLRPRRVPRPRLWALGFAAASAAAVWFAAIGPGLLPEPPRAAPVRTPVPGASPTVAVAPVMGRGLLGGAVDNATAASWQFARLASEPARRLGKQMMDVSFQPADLPTSSDLDLPALDAESFSPALLDQMSGLLAAGVRPLSSSARQAFGFLRVPRSDKVERPVVTPSAKGV